MGELMSTQSRTNAGNQSDLMLWVAGGVVAAVGVAWLVIMKPWAGPGAEPERTPIIIAAALPSDTPPSRDDAPPPDAATTLDNPLRMAELAYDAGMLIEPEEYSAWTLYARVAKAEPDNATATAGLVKVADDLIRRGETALDQGRFDDARGTVERIRAVLPDHPGAKELAAKIWPQVSAAEQTPLELKPDLPAPAATRIAPVEIAAAPAPPKKPEIDPIAEASAAFERAMAAGRLLTPVDQSAKHYVGVLAAASAEHEATRRARQTLSSELLSRATQALEALDTEAAGIWIDEAEAVGAEAAGVRAARAAMTEQLIAMESAKPLPASALNLATYVAPTYPTRALERGLEGWVDIEFTVGTDGKTRDIVVPDASHENYFRREAVAAVEQWTFEPRVFMNRAIEQRSYTRIRFVE
jgi:TonB family protein